MAGVKSLRSSSQITIEMFAPPFRQFADGEAIGFGRGRIDNFCVYHRIEGLTRAPLDTEYFDFIEGLSRSHSAKMVYRRFVTLYEFVKKEVSEEAIQLIDKLSSDFPKEYRACQTYFTILYLAMVAEENYPPVITLACCKISVAMLNSAVISG